MAQSLKPVNQIAASQREVLTCPKIFIIMSVMIRFFNTYSGKIEEFTPINPGEVKLYTCGPTVYDYAHIGNYRAYMFEDLLKRFLQFMDYSVTHVTNITDIDDKIIKAVISQNTSIEEYTQKYIDAFYHDIGVLNISKADFYPRATEHIQEMAHMVKGLQEKGYAYEKEGNYYFSITKFKNYGKLAKINLEDLQSGVRIDADEYEKESVHDFALWKAKKEKEPFWESVVGPGRPGWHIECSVMSAKYLGDSFDIHCGGVDNIFPHHENEIAQSEAYTGHRFVNYWLHCQHLIRDGDKMSKSKGNTITLQDLIEIHHVDPMAIRLLLLSTHYRKMLNFTFEAMHQAEAALQRIKDFVFELENGTFPAGSKTSCQGLINQTRKGFIKGMSDDLNISEALSAVFSLIKQVNISITKKQISNRDAESLLELIQEFDQVLGLFPKQEKADINEDIQSRIAEREQARKEKNYALADQIRDELLNQGIILEDTKDGVRWKRTSPKK